MAHTTKVVFVTGATGMSRAAALEFARRGLHVAMLSRTRAEVETAIREVEAEGVEGLVLQGDVSKAEDLVQAYDRIIEKWGRLDVVFANAGINGTWAPIEDLTPEDWRQTIDINLTGTFLTIKYAVPHLKKQGGAIVLTASINGTRTFSNTGASAYSASKAGQVALMKLLALELAPQGVRINAVCPGAIDTEIDENTNREALERIRYPAEFPKGEVPLTHGKPGTPEQVAKLVAFLASDDAAHITGTEVWIDGGESLLV